MFLGKFLQPFLGYQHGCAFGQLGYAFEISAKNAVELVVIRFVLDQACARQIVEIIDTAVDYPFFERLEQHQKLPDRDRQSTLFKLEKELDQHDLKCKNRYRILQFSVDIAQGNRDI